MVSGQAECYFLYFPQGVQGFWKLDWVQSLPVSYWIWGNGITFPIVLGVKLRLQDWLKTNVSIRL